MSFPGTFAPALFSSTSVEQVFSLEVTTTSPNQQMSFTTGADGLMDIYWGDGDSDLATMVTTPTHTYVVAGTYNLKMSGLTTALALNTTLGKVALTGVLSPIRGMPALTDVTNLFFNNTNIVGSIPAGFFDDCPLITTFYYAFLNSTFTGPCPRIFDNNTLATIFYRCFYGCDIESVPSGLFDNNSLVTDFNGLFQNCNTLLTAPSDLITIGKHPSVNNLGFTYYGCTGLTSTVPELWVDFPAATHTSCFANSVSIANYADIPAGWK